MARVRLEVKGFERDLRDVIEDIASPAARSKILADTARSLVEEADRRNAAALGSVPPKETTVDGVLGASLDSVRPDGTIIVEYKIVQDALLLIDRFLREYSPVGRGPDRRPGHPGLYRDSHVLFADGNFVRLKQGQPIPPANSYTFLNTTPYARRIERGWSSQAPAGVYQVAATLAQRRFGNFVSISFGYEAPMAGAISTWARQASARVLARNIRGGNRAGHNEWLRRQPAIFVSPR